MPTLLWKYVTIFKNERIILAVFRRMYAEEHPYFITMVTENREPLLVENVAILRDAFQHSKSFFKYTIDSIVVMPDHLHMIIIPEENDAYPKIVRSIKTYFSKELKESWAGMPTLRTQSQIKKRELGIWQRRFYEHTVRDERDLQRLRDYIHYNPVKHGWVKRVYDWKHSSFHKYHVQGMYETEWVNLSEDLDLA
jgi:putative transposase